MTIEISPKKFQKKSSTSGVDLKVRQKYRGSFSFNCVKIPYLVKHTLLHSVVPYFYLGAHLAKISRGCKKIFFVKKVLTKSKNVGNFDIFLIAYSFNSAPALPNIQA